nr:hypothetical transcript [Hymenolepis microstoma]
MGRVRWSWRQSGNGWEPTGGVIRVRIHADRDLSIPECHGGADHLVPYTFGCFTNTLLSNNFSFTNIELHQMKSSGYACNALEEMLLAQNLFQKLLDT